MYLPDRVSSLIKSPFSLARKMREIFVGNSPPSILFIFDELALLRSMFYFWPPNSNFARVLPPAAPAGNKGKKKKVPRKTWANGSFVPLVACAQSPRALPGRLDAASANSTRGYRFVDVSVRSQSTRRHRLGLYSSIPRGARARAGVAIFLKQMFASRRARVALPPNIRRGLIDRANMRREESRAFAKIKIVSNNLYNPKNKYYISVE